MASRPAKKPHSSINDKKSWHVLKAGNLDRVRRDEAAAAAATARAEADGREDRLGALRAKVGAASDPTRKRKSADEGGGDLAPAFAARGTRGEADARARGAAAPEGHRLGGDGYAAVPWYARAPQAPPRPADAVPTRTPADGGGRPHGHGGDGESDEAAACPSHRHRHRHRRRRRRHGDDGGTTRTAERAPDATDGRGAAESGRADEAPVRR